LLLAFRPSQSRAGIKITGDIITGCDDAADAPEAMAVACDFRYEQLCGKQAGLDQLAGCYCALRDRDLLRAGQAEAAVAAPHRA
jgi:hypothetical protein